MKLSSEYNLHIILLTSLTSGYIDSKPIKLYLLVLPKLNCYQQ